MYQLHEKIGLRTNISQAWEFFSNASNLRLITPPQLNMSITSKVPELIYPGLIITYNVHPILGIPLEWVTEITHVNEPYGFIDEQRAGPYRMWHHEHKFYEVEDGVIVEDLVSYLMPFGPFGKIAHELFVRKQLHSIFSYRTKILSEKFGTFMPKNDSVKAPSDSAVIIN